MKMKAIMHISDHNTTRLWPKAVTSQPLMMAPMKPPTLGAWLKPDCQAAVSWYPLGVDGVTPTDFPNLI